MKVSAWVLAPRLASFDRRTSSQEMRGLIAELGFKEKLRTQIWIAANQDQVRRMTMIGSEFWLAEY